MLRNNKNSARFDWSASILLAMSVGFRREKAFVDAQLDSSERLFRRRSGGSLQAGMLALQSLLSGLSIDLRDISKYQKSSSLTACIGGKSGFYYSHQLSKLF